jgi:hypothetical protein
MAVDATRTLRGALAGAAAAEYPVGLAIHVLNGAAFGALYANAARVLPVPAPLRGPLAGLAEHAATWPGMPLLLRLRSDLPAEWGSGRALAQATWRHALFGTVLGELERRLNPPEPEPRPVDPAAAASNGHGSAEHLVSTS